MFWPTRVSTALVLAIAMATVPFIMEQCAASCDAGTSASAPACHHLRLSGPRIGRTPTPCGHDHSERVTTTSEATPVRRTLTAAVTTTVVPEPVITAVHGLATAFASPPHEQPSLQLAVSLRL